MLQFAFWACFLLVFYTYVGYAIVICLLAKFWPYKKNSEQSNQDKFPELTLCIAAYNEVDIIDMKMDNCLSLDYPLDKLTILWVIDGSSDDSFSVLTNKYPQVKVLYKTARQGKTAALNHAMTEIKTDLVVFTDANCLISKNSLKAIAEKFEDSKVGCVAGEKRITYFEDDASASKGEGFYWKYESFLKKMDDQYYSTIGAAGELFAVRRDLFVSLSEEILLDDFIISMRITQAGYRIAYAPEAYAVERGSLNIEEEKKRKIRISAGGWQSVMMLTDLLNIFKYGKLSFQYISHRVLRWTITPFALFLLFPLSFVLAFMQGNVNCFFSSVFVLQILFYVLVAIGYVKRNQENISKIYFVPFYFVFMNYNVLEGLIYLKNKSKTGVWEKSKRKF